MSYLVEIIPCNSLVLSQKINLEKPMPSTSLANGNAGDRPPDVVADDKPGVSMMEQLVPEITTHALSYLDYPSLCRLSMTNSLMRKAANDDNAWKALYHKVIALFTCSCVAFTVCLDE